MITYYDLRNAFRDLHLGPGRPVIAHASLSAFGQVQGGADTLLEALLACIDSLIMPTFTYKTMIIPEMGPRNNAMVYGSGKDTNRLAEFYDPNMPADRLMGIVPETLRRHASAQRSSHPILSFAGINAYTALKAQTLEEPLAPIRCLVEAGGWALLLGVDHTVNTSIHYGERLAGRKTFIRWALTREGIRECPGFPNCSDGFQALTPRLDRIVRSVRVGTALVQAFPLPDLIEITRSTIVRDPRAALCTRSYCERCRAVRAES
jgi:aminoglycoside 3-N-acetyltransferase